MIQHPIRLSFNTDLAALFLGLNEIQGRSSQLSPSTYTLRGPQETIFEAGDLVPPALAFLNTVIAAGSFLTTCAAHINTLDATMVCTAVIIRSRLVVLLPALASRCRNFSRFRLPPIH